MKQIDLQNKSQDELREVLNELKAKLAKLSFELEADTLKDTSQVKKIKKDVARVLTVLKQQLKD